MKRRSGRLALSADRLLPGGGGRHNFVSAAGREVGVDLRAPDTKIREAMIVERHQVLIGPLPATPIGDGPAGREQEIYEEHSHTPVRRVCCIAQEMVSQRNMRKNIAAIQLCFSAGRRSL